jgi:CRISPR-associated endonuclease/helicase Cas3
MDNHEWVIQSVQEHCRNTADIAGNALDDIHIHQSAYLAGLLHDAGKFTKDFSEYLAKAVSGTAPPRGSVNHTFSGVRYLLNHYHEAKNENDLSPIVSEILAFAAGAHHGLFNCIDENGHSGFQHRLDKPDIHYEEAMKNFFAQCADQKELDQLFDEAVKELSAFMLSLCDLAQQNDSYDGEVSFYLGLLARLILSAVIEGDRQDTAGFMNGMVSTKWQDDRRKMWMNCLARIEQKLTKYPSETPIACARQNISEQCRSFAERPGGIFQLHVPTGGGKTLASLRFAIAHAAKWNKSRVIFVSPLLSILDQNAAVLREFIEDNSIILEHHSNVVHADDGREIVDNNDAELLEENWNAPVIITTLVQLLNTIFCGKTSCIRRFHALVNSVIVIDEVQTVPTRMLTLFNLAVNFLSKMCGATVVLCSATQPCLERTMHPIFDPIDMVPYEKSLWEPFARTKIIDGGALMLQEIPDFVIDKLNTVKSILIICNKKAEAAFLYRELCLYGYPCFHLSASMCMAHRCSTLSKLQNALRDDSKTICIATQVIEAGVDISFDCVIRLTAGMDNIIQAAGRCNRNAEKPEPVPVYALQCADEKLGKLKDIQRAKDATISLLAQFRSRPNEFQNDLSSDEAIRYYYNRLYQEMPCGFQDYTIKDKPSLYSLLSQNESYLDNDTGYTLNQAFKEAGTLFQVFDDESEDVIVPYESGAECISDLCSEAALYDPDYLQHCIERAKPYTISILGYQKKQLMGQNGLYAICDKKILVLQESNYDDAVGLVIDGAQNDYLEV